MLYAIALLLPLWFIPLPIEIEFGREMTFGALIALGVIFWLLGILKEGKLHFIRSPLLYAGLLLLLVWGASTVFALEPFVSLMFADPIGEKFSTLLLGFFLFLLASNMRKSREGTGIFIFLLIVSGTLTGLVSAAQLFSGISLYGKIFSFAGSIEFNPVGTIYGLAIFYTLLLATVIGLLISHAHAWKGWVNATLLVSALVFAVNLLLVNYQVSWIILLGSMIVLFALVFRQHQSVFGFESASIATGDEATGKKLGWRYWATLSILVFSIVMILMPGRIYKKVNLRPEVTPAFGATLGITQSVFKEGIKSTLIGSGPGLFGLDWVKYKDPSLNKTIFWDVRFNQGSSWVTTIPSTVGILGTLAFLLFIFLALFIFLRQFLAEQNQETVYSSGLFLGFTASVIAAFLYPVNLTFLLYFFAVLGVLSSTLVSTKSEGAVSRTLGVYEENYTFKSPWALFLSSLAIIFLVSIGIAILYFDINRFRSSYKYQEGSVALQHGGVSEAVAALEKTAELDSRNFRSFSNLVLVRMEKIRSLIQKASVGEHVEQDFQAQVQIAIQNSQRAVTLFPSEPSLWRTQGSLYELIVPYIQGSERQAVSSYKKAADLDPLNPSIWVDLGRTGLLYAEKIRVFSTQGTVDKKQSEQAYIGTLKEARAALERAIQLKSDLAGAHFLLAQVATKEGNPQAAIQSAENAKLSAPFDIGIAFQLGMLHYQANDLTRAEQEFLRAIGLNSNYSNARYFLGLIYDRKGEKGRAISEFQIVQSLNPGNEEVKRILANLRAGKPALASIVPPASPPEKRKTTPVEEKESKR